MDPALLAIVEARLSEVRDQSWAGLVIAACDGDDSLEAALDGRAVGPARTAAGSRTDAAPGAYLRSITVEGFRGIGPRAALEVPPGPGLTLVVGRNGSGKSSFAEGLEILLTGSNWRWAHRSRVWVEGWRNLHHAARAEVSAEFAIEGDRGATSVTRTWSTDDIESSTVRVARPSRKAAGDLDVLGWVSPLDAYRPFLSYNELGSMFDEGPTRLHDRLSAILGLGDLDRAAEALRAARLEREKAVSGAKKALVPLLVRLRSVDDERARRAVDALSGRSWDLQAAAVTVEPSARDGDPREAIGVLRTLLSIRAPEPEATDAVAGRLRDAADALDGLRGTAASDAAQLAGLLRQALVHHERHGDGKCPVCGRRGALSAAWHAETEQSLARLEELAVAWRTARAAADAATREAERLLVEPPDVLDRATAAGVDAGELEAAWRELLSVPEGADLRVLATHLEARVAPVAEAADALRRAAAAELERREDAWRPVGRDLAAWLGAAQAAVAGDAAIDALRHAEKWLKETSSAIRTERFEPISRAVIENWRDLRQQSSVELEGVALTGTGSQRRVEMDVAIDGVQGAALGVMSQGELNSIALGLFLPRATLPESPFRFVVIDDPVQSMDPARVDGLATVLARTARRRQVIVFTHDDRLPEALRRLNLEAHVLAVTRHEDSVVEVTRAWNPVRQHLDDARALVRTEELPAGIAAHVVPGYCRAAMEAACIEVVRRRRIGRGEAHGDVEAAVEGATTLRSHLALALFDDADRGSDVSRRLREWGEWADQAFSVANQGAHGAYRGSLEDLVRDTERVCRTIRERPL